MGYVKSDRNLGIVSTIYFITEVGGYIRLLLTN